MLGLHFLTREFWAKLLSLKTSGRVNNIILNFLAYAVSKLVLEENSCVKKKLRSFIGTNLKWASTYIKRINYTEIYAQAHYHQRPEMFPKINKRKDYALWGSWKSDIKENKLLQKILTRREQSLSPSTQEGWARVVPATCPGKQEHFTVWERSSIRFLLQHLCTATTSHVPCFTWCWPGHSRGEGWRERNTSVPWGGGGCAALQDAGSPHRRLEPQECKEAKYMARSLSLYTNFSYKISFCKSVFQSIFPHPYKAIGRRAGWSIQLEDEGRKNGTHLSSFAFLTSIRFYI